MLMQVPSFLHSYLATGYGHMDSARAHVQPRRPTNYSVPKMSRKATTVLLELLAIAPSCWKNPCPFPRHLKFQKGARICSMCLSAFNMSEKIMVPNTRILIALIEHHTLDSKLYNGPSCIYLGLSTGQYLPTYLPT
jgi:hypothetical protein